MVTASLNNRPGLFLYPILFLPMFFGAVAVWLASTCVGLYDFGGCGSNLSS
ncbi:MAG: hypothetical protein ACRCZY_08900 [Phocaeicola sp.]